MPTSGAVYVFFLVLFCFLLCVCVCVWAGCFCNGFYAFFCLLLLSPFPHPSIQRLLCCLPARFHLSSSECARIRLLQCGMSWFLFYFVNLISFVFFCYIIIGSPVTQFRSVFRFWSVFDWCYLCFFVVIFNSFACFLSLFLFCCSFIFYLSTSVNVCCMIILFYLYINSIMQFIRFLAIY